MFPAIGLVNEKIMNSDFFKKLCVKKWLAFFLSKIIFHHFVIAEGTKDMNYCLESPENCIIHTCRSENSRNNQEVFLLVIFVPENQISAAEEFQIMLYILNYGSLLNLEANFATEEPLELNMIKGINYISDRQNLLFYKEIDKYFEAAEYQNEFNENKEAQNNVCFTNYIVFVAPKKQFFPYFRRAKGFFGSINYLIKNYIFMGSTFKGYNVKNPIIKIPKEDLEYNFIKTIQFFGAERNKHLELNSYFTCSYKPNSDDFTVLVSKLSNFEILLNKRKKKTGYFEIYMILIIFSINIGFITSITYNLVCFFIYVTSKFPKRTLLISETNRRESISTTITVSKTKTPNSSSFSELSSDF